MFLFVCFNLGCLCFFSPFFFFFFYHMHLQFFFSLFSPYLTTTWDNKQILRSVNLSIHLLQQIFSPHETESGIKLWESRPQRTTCSDTMQGRPLRERSFSRTQLPPDSLLNCFSLCLLALAGGKTIPSQPACWHTLVVIKPQ